MHEYVVVINSHLSIMDNVHDSHACVNKHVPPQTLHMYNEIVCEIEFA